MILVLRQLFDPIADQLSLALGPRVRSCVIEQWLSGCRIRHRVGRSGVETEIHARDGSPLLDGAVSVVLNRVSRVPAARYQGAAAEDQSYALAEAAALFWSCIEGLPCPVINTVPALGLVARASHPLAQAAAAARAGLLTLDYRMATRVRYGDAGRMRAMDAPFAMHGPSINGPACLCSLTSMAAGSLWIVGDQVVGALDGVSAGNALQFARHLGLGFGVLDFERDAAGHWRWTGVDPLPLQAPPAVVQALAAYLAQYADAAERESVVP